MMPDVIVDVGENEKVAVVVTLREHKIKEKLLLLLFIDYSLSLHKTNAEACDY